MTGIPIFGPAPRMRMIGAVAAIFDVLSVFVVAEG